MASPFFSSYWNQPSESRFPPSVPLKRKSETPSPKVISIPIHFVGSEENRSDSGLNRSDFALRIQKVFRGFLVRKSVNKIVSIKKEVEQTERRIARIETVELIRKDAKERVRINETLMALLFKLDSVRGIDSGVRELRRGVIKKAIALQEKVDALVVTDPHTENENKADSAKSHGGEIVDHSHPVSDEMPIENPPVSMENMPIENDEMPIENLVDHSHVDDDEEEEEEGYCVVKEIVEEQCNTMNSKTEMLQKEDEVMDDCGKEEETGGEKQAMSEVEVKEKKTNNNSEELQSQMIRMMSDLVEKNEMQTRMINSLTHRVAQLEKGLLCDKLRRSNKKKKRQHDGKQQ